MTKSDFDEQSRIQFDISRRTSFFMRSVGFALFVCVTQLDAALVASWYDTGARLTAAAGKSSAPPVPRASAVTAAPAASSLLFEEGKKAVMQREKTQRMLKVRMLTAEGAAASRERALTQRMLKVLILKAEGAAASRERALTQRMLKVLILKAEGLACVSRHDVMQAACEARLKRKASAADDKASPAPAGFAWGGTF